MGSPGPSQSVRKLDHGGLADEKGSDSLREMTKSQTHPVHPNSSTSLGGSVRSKVNSEERQAGVLGRGSLML